MAKTEAGRKNARKIANDETPEQAIGVFQAVMDSLLPKTAEQADLYIFTKWTVLADWLKVADSLTRHSFDLSAILVWNKEGPGMGDLDSWGMGHEFILFLKKGRRPSSDRRRSGVLNHPQVRPNKLIHPHEKPVPLLSDLIRHSTSPGDVLVDPFAGSWSLGRAARLMGRSCLGIELDEHNYTVALNAFNTEEAPAF